MSLATTGGGGLSGAGAGGGLTLAHDASGGVMAQNVATPPPMADAGATGTAATATATNVVECYDKTQPLTLSQVQQTAHLPIAAVDLHASQMTVAWYPPKAPEPGAPVFMGKMKARLHFKGNNEAAHKALRKYLTQSKPYRELKDEHVLVTEKDSDNVTLDRPHLLLGQRRISQVPAAWSSQLDTEPSASHAIAPESEVKSCWWTDSTLDGSVPHATSVNYDMDRVVAKVRLHASKKALTVLPEEATGLVLHQARSHVYSKVSATQQSTSSKKKNAATTKSTTPTNISPDDLTRFPMVVAVPSWSLHDAYVEALTEAAATGGLGGDGVAAPVVVQPRSICALMGNFVHPPTADQNKFLARLATVQQALLKQHKQRNIKEPFLATTLVICIGTTPEGLEATALQFSYPQNDVPLVFFEEFRVVANVSQLVEHAKDAPSELATPCLQKMRTILEQVAPDADGPAAILTYGSTAEQDAINQAVASHKKTEEWLARVPILASSVEAVATGAALLGGVSLGRHTSGKSLALRLQATAAVATGIVRYYHPSQVKKTPPTDDQVKVIFDFDRRLPAGPYAMEFKASECAVHAQRLLDGTSQEQEDDKFWKSVKEAESTKNMPKRENAALNFTIQVFQKMTRDGPWKAVGNPMAPLVKLDTQIDADTDEDKDETKVACEEVTLELNMAVSGTLSTAWVGERESVVQAVKSARGRLFEFYGWWGFAILLFGGFFIKSYWEDYVWKRDTQRLLDYYKHVIPGATQDGDRDTASWLAYKYRHKKEKLWQNLEEKYGVPVPDEWPEQVEGEGGDNKEEEEVDLDQDATREKEEASPNTPDL